MVLELAGILGVLTLGLLSPGPDFLIVVRNSMGGERGRAFATVLGIVAGLAVQTSLIALGVAALPERLMEGVALAGAAFLAWLGLRALLAPAGRDAAAGRESTAAGAARSGFAQGLLCNLTNPKAFFFFVSVFAQVIPPGVSPGWRVALPVVVVAHGAVLWSFVVLAVQSAPVAARLARMQRWLPRCFGVALLGFAAFVVADVLAA